MKYFPGTRKHVKPNFREHCLKRHWRNSMSRLMKKPIEKITTKWSVRPAKTQICLGIRQVWSESLQCAEWVAKDPVFLHADSEDSDQTGRMPRLIWVFAGCKGHFVGFVVKRLIWRWVPIFFIPRRASKHLNWLLWMSFEPRHDKTNKMSVRPAKTQISLGIRSVWSELRCPHEESLGP